MSDEVRRFLLEDSPVRGEIVSLDDSWREVSRRHDLPEPVLHTLGELSAAAVLLGATLKFDGALILQIHGDGPVALMVVECQADGRLRATVKLREGEAIAPDASLVDLVNRQGQGRFAVTLDPRIRSENRQPWQGIVPFEGVTIAEVLEQYMARSEQLPTRLWLAANGQRATGLLLQKLPAEGGRSAAPNIDADGWNRMQHLADTLSREELIELSSEQVLTRLFWDERLRGFDPRRLRFACGCSRQKVSGMLQMLGRDEIESLIVERGEVEVRCDFCNEPYHFDPVDCATLFLKGLQSAASDARH